jgi:hypothetical protein
MRKRSNSVIKKIRKSITEVLLDQYEQFDLKQYAKNVNRYSFTKRQAAEAKAQFNSPNRPSLIQAFI